MSDVIKIDFEMGALLIFCGIGLLCCLYCIEEEKYYYEIDYENRNGNSIVKGTALLHFEKEPTNSEIRTVIQKVLPLDNKTKKFVNIHLIEKNKITKEQYDRTNANSIKKFKLYYFYYKKITELINI
jgi:hypothetical protein